MLGYDPDAVVVLRPICRKDAMPIAQREVVLRTILFAEVTPVTGRVTTNELSGVDAVLLHDPERAMCGDDLPQLEEEAVGWTVMWR
jgi:hypothetical protein